MMECERINAFLGKLDEFGTQGILAGCATAEDDIFNQFTGEEPKNNKTESV